MADGSGIAAGERCLDRAVRSGRGVLTDEFDDLTIELYNGSSLVSAFQPLELDV